MTRPALRTALSAACAALALGATGWQAAAAQDAEAAPAGPTPRMADGRPDLSGVWWGGGDVGGPGFRPGPPRAEGAPPPTTFADLYTPEAAAHAATLRDKDDPTLKCMPTAFGTLNVRLWDVGAVGQIVSTPDFMVFLQETYHGYQIVPTDGRAHRDFVPPSYRGDAIGRWEGDAFVVEVTNFTDDTWIWAEGRVSHHSDQLRVVERYTRPDANTLVIEATVEDPGVLREPWVVPTQTLQLAPFDQLLPLICSGAETDALMDAAQSGE